MKKFFDGIQNLNGAKFITLNGYVSETSGEVANHNILVNIDVMNAKRKDAEMLVSADVQAIAKKSAKQFAIEVFQTALTEMRVSAVKNISENKEDRTAQSNAQTDAYIQIGKGLKIHKETGNLHIFGYHMNKTVLFPGEFKPVKSADKTLAKKEITKVLKLRAGKFRTFIIANISNVSINGKNLIIDCAKN
ncbi:MAG TPA: hypothetical protein VK172_10605 [Lentimicrobium sp.]|nr:hypothetical protein [Lentimicrobium sp.]